ncbi:hypothetical protein BGW36DRAFT_420317, partial [Talaromyces proteolyticus]
MTSTRNLKLSYDDYTVAWICALPVEMAAAKVMLDEVHEDLPALPHDNNVYTLGRIRKHNVVIAGLPNGKYGNTSATVVAMQLIAGFPSIRFGLMVGIGGGVPNKDADIRLGDIVVSKPTGSYGGVVRYDYGKALNRHFERTGMLNQPPALLLNALTKLQSNHLTEESQIPNFLSEMEKKLGQRAENFACPQQEDRLYQADYHHIGDSKTCEHCDHTKTVQRIPTNRAKPAIHYGLIASGNSVIKDSGLRDFLSRELGVYCVEMEAAGLMDSFPCVVIRGICDYADSHKNKKWQGYAAATAAAYAKELLTVIHEKSVTDSRATLSVTKYGIYHGNHKQNLQQFGKNDGRIELEKLLERVSNYDPERTQRRLSSKRVIGTTQWFLDHPTFKEWFTDKSFPALWCSGKIGSGKTIIATSVIDVAMRRSSELPLGPTVSYFCEDGPRLHNGQPAVSILSSFIKQLCEFLNLRSTPYPDIALQALRKFFGQRRMVPDVEDLKEIFTDLFHYVPDTTYIVDGFDTLHSRDAKIILDCFQQLFYGSVLRHQSQILLLSRDQIPGYIDLTRFIPGIRQISINNNNLPDIEIYIKAKIKDKMMVRKLTDSTPLIQELSRDLLEKSTGMFLWVYLQLEILWDECFSDNEIRAALEQLPRGLDETYQRCMKRVTDTQDIRPLRTLKWISYAARPLHIEELREAIAFDLHDTIWDSGKISSREFVAGCCSNLAVVDSNDDFVYFAHPSVKQFLEKYIAGRIPGYPTSPLQGELECGELCVTYLSFSNFGLELGKHDECVSDSLNPMALAAQSVGPSLLSTFFLRRPSKKIPSYPLKIQMIRKVPPDTLQYKFLDYASSNWPLHTKNITQQSRAWRKFERLALQFSETWNFHPWKSSGRSQRSYLHGLLVWAVKGQHQPLLSIVLNMRQDVQEICNLPSIEERLPVLHIASRLGYETVVESLLDLCDVKLLDENGYTPLHHAADKGHIKVVQLLLGTNELLINIRSKCQSTPFLLAARNGHEIVAKLLLDKGADLDTKELITGGNQLLQAAWDGQEAVARVLLDKGADIEAKDPHGWTPLLHAAGNGHEAVVKLLLDKGADIEDKDPHGLTPLLHAAQNGHDIIVKLLLDKGADIEVKDSIIGKTPLLWAAWDGHDTIVKLLLDRGANLEAKDSLTKQTPLLLAAQNGYEAIVKLLLDKGANLEVKDSLTGQTPLLLAAQNGYEAIVKLL